MFYHAHLRALDVETTGAKGAKAGHGMNIVSQRNRARADSDKRERFRGDLVREQLFQSEIGPKVRLG
jgi:hypothetical protein